MENRCFLKVNTINTSPELRLSLTDYIAILCTQQLKVGDWVHLADKVDPKTTVGTGQVCGLGDGGMFHNRPIPAQYVRVNVETVSVNVPLFVSVEFADQTNLQDAIGSSVLWPRGLTFRKKKT